MSEYTTISDTGFTGCVRGQLVAHVNGKYTPAYAAWERLADGSLRPSASSYVCGILITSPDVSGNGTLLTFGTVTDPSILSVIFGTSAPAEGGYYLTTDGKVSAGVIPGLLPVYCGTVTASGKFIFRPAAPEYGGHRHTNYPLSGALFSGSQYDPNRTDTTFTQMLNGLPPQALTVLSGGVLLKGGSENEAGTDYYTSGGFLFISGASVNAEGYTVCGVNPLIGTNPEIRAIAPAAGNSTTQVTQLYGTVYIDNDYPEANTVSSGGRCVAEISKAGVTYAPVVNEIRKAGGIDIKNNGGIVTISDRAVAQYIDFQTINANNVLVGATTEDVLLTFPSGVAASVLGVCRLPALSEGQWKFQVFAWPNTSTTLNINASVKTITAPTAVGEPVTSSTSGGTVNDTVFYASGGALVHTVLSTNAGAQVVAAGVYITDIV